jgi:hypothetical protein
MSLTLNYPATDSSSQVTKGVTIPSLTYATDWAVQKVQVTNGDRLANLTTPTDFEEKIEYQVKERANVYAGTTVDRVYWPASTKGREITVDFRSTPYATDSSDATFRQGFPIKIRTTITFPLNELIDETVLAHEFQRAIGCFFETSDTTVANFFARHMRGATRPVDL